MSNFPYFSEKNPDVEFTVRQFNKVVQPPNYQFVCKSRLCEDEQKLLQSAGNAKKQNKFPFDFSLDDGNKMKIEDSLNKKGNSTFENFQNCREGDQVSTSSSSAINQQIQKKIIYDKEQRRQKMQEYCEIKLKNINLKDKHIANMLKIKQHLLPGWKKEFPCDGLKIKKLRKRTNREQRRTLVQKYNQMKAEDHNLNDSEIAEKMGIGPSLLSTWKTEFYSQNVFSEIQGNIINFESYSNNRAPKWYMH